MNFDEQAIAQIVAEVVRRIRPLVDEQRATSSGSRVPADGKAGPPPSPAPPSSPSAGKPATTDSSSGSSNEEDSSKEQPSGDASGPKPARSSAGELAVDARVVSLASIEGRLEGVRRVVVGPKAVVTPSVKDELKKKRIRLQRSEPEEEQPAGGELTIIRSTSEPEVDRAADTLKLPTGAGEQKHVDLREAVRGVVESTGTAEQIAILFTEAKLPAVCLLNRHQSVRAAAVENADETREAIAAVGANVLVIDPRCMTSNQWSVTLKTFRSHLPRACPGMLQ